MRGGRYITIKSELYQYDIRFLKSRQGLTKALRENYGNFQSLQIHEGTATLRVPKDDMASWIGSQGRVVGALKEILGVDKVVVVGIESE